MLKSHSKSNFIPEPPEGVYQKRSIRLLSGAHAINDTYSSFLPPLLPLIISNLGLSKTEAGLLAVFQQSPSVIQPIIGYLADHISLRYLVILAPALTGITMSLVVVAPTYLAIVILLFLSGISSAGLHSIAPAMAGRLSGRQLGKGMSIFIVGGSIGFGLGPILIVSFIENFSIDLAPWLMVVGILTSVFLYFSLRNISGRPPNNEKALSLKSALKGMRNIMMPLFGILGIAGFMTTATGTYLPVFLSEEGVDLMIVGASLSIIEIAGAAGMLIAGPLSDKIGRRIVLLILLMLAPLSMAALLTTHGWIRYLTFLVMGFGTLSSIPILLAMAQEKFPDNRALANGLVLGMSFVLRSIAAVIIGVLSDVYSLRLAFTVTALISILALPLVFLLPKK